MFRAWCLALFCLRNPTTNMWVSTLGPLYIYDTNEQTHGESQVGPCCLLVVLLLAYCVYVYMYIYANQARRSAASPVGEIHITHADAYT